MNCLSPSILAADFNVLGEQMKMTEDNGAEYLHFDVMDGVFVDNISYAELSEIYVKLVKEIVERELENEKDN